MQHAPKVGIGLLIFKDDKILLGERIGSHGAHSFCGTDGHLDHLESFIDCAVRETREEAGIEIENVRFLCLTNVRDYAPKHYVDIGLVADWKSGTPAVLEPEKRKNWDWYEIDELPEPLFGMVPNYIEAHKTGRVFFDA